ncbi:hypothetical protein FZEAL_2721 [Fusarium zealandicum]|uniref:Uncharacterized protein n=1 Tax=Fusarium zealandicum TaxID=1053134 RepID=A0A8H4UQY3_9HYPO|nr:hypothetical protein FZEAL_2721 [Fusarium zealandicum]
MLVNGHASISIESWHQATTRRFLETMPTEHCVDDIHHLVAKCKAAFDVLLLHRIEQRESLDRFPRRHEYEAKREQFRTWVDHFCADYHCTSEMSLDHTLRDEEDARVITIVELHALFGDLRCRERASRLYIMC